MGLKNRFKREKEFACMRIPGSSTFTVGKLQNQNKTYERISRSPQAHREIAIKDIGRIVNMQGFKNTQ